MEKRFLIGLVLVLAFAFLAYQSNPVTDGSEQVTAQFARSTGQLYWPSGPFENVHHFDIPRPIQQEILPRDLIYSLTWDDCVTSTVQNERILTCNIPG